MPVITTGSHPKLLWPGVHATWGQVYEGYEKEHEDLYEMLDSEMAYEQDVQVTGFPLAVVKGQGAPVVFAGENQGWVTTYNHIAYGLGYAVTKEELDDNQYEVVAMRRAKANAFSMAQTVETVAAFLYNNAFTSSFYAMPDGQALISASHVNVTGGTSSNILSPSADLSEVALEDICIQIMGAQNDNGLIINLMPQSLHVDRSEFFNANRILKSVLQSGTTSNNINVLRAVNAFPKGIKLNHFFNTAGNWFVRTNCPNGMQFFWRTRPEFDQDNDFPTKNALAASYMRFSVGATDFRGIYGSPHA
ncbi:MAG TPA: hypothetical protein VN039_04475 [Nitrospira sp.]|nr:hypothetical protein [Nitrospira sp.]